MVRCQNRGCRRHARWPTHFCGQHASGQERVALAPPTKPPIEKATGYLCHFSIVDDNIINRLTQFVHDYSTKCDTSALLTGCRKVLKFEVGRALETVLQSVVVAAREKVAFPLAKTRIMGPAIIVAPPVNSRSNFWSCGPIHRDYDDTEHYGGVLLPFLC